MKKTFVSILVSAAVVLTLSSCNDWLQASSSTRIQQEKLLTNRDGFLDALTGVYLTMGSNSLYGEAFTWHYADLICYPYNEVAATDTHPWQAHSYTNTYVKNDIAGMWTTAYNVIANINSVLEYLDSRRNVFTSELEFNLVKGELLGLRAFVHFDLIRLFGTCGWAPSEEAKITVPYVTEFSPQATPQRTNAQTRDLLLADLSAAIDCLKADPITGVVPDGWNQGPNAEGYWNKRNTHFNLYAARMLEARVYQWSGDLTHAAELAQGIIDDAIGSGAVEWIDAEAQINTLDNSARNWTFTVEQLFQLDVTGLHSIVTTVLIAGLSSDFDALHIKEEFVGEVLYKLNDNGYIGGAEDIRGTAMMLKYNRGGYDCYKLYGTSSTPLAFRNKMPIMKLSELYMMIAENYLDQGDLLKVKETLNTIRSHRGIQSDLPATTDATAEFYREIMREFINEGQIVYWFKRKGLDNYPGASYFDVQLSDLTLPYPQAEINYGRTQEL